jgi:thiol-disulfide isomerase/thioredoxin
LVDEPGVEPTHREVSPRSRRIYLVVALVIAACAVAAVLIASAADPHDVAPRADLANLPVYQKAPGLDGAKGWINTEPLSAADLHGKVVVYDFWTYSCVNCVRTLPYLEAWYSRYADDGLVIVGVHSPEFQFEKNHDNVRAAVTRLRVNYPVALDDDMDIWNRFSNQYWPAKYITDRKGHLRYFHFGEGSYGEGEAVIRKLLGVPTSTPHAKPVGAGPGENLDKIVTVTQETYLGLERGSAGAQIGVVTYPAAPTTLTPGDARLEGSWNGGDEQVTATAPGATIALGYNAGEVNLVMGTASGAPVDVTVEIDGHPLRPNERTKQTMVDADGSTFVRVTASDLYRLVHSPSVQEHTIRLTARSAGLEAFAFTFGT